jgi:hypothetical protein
MNTPARLGLYGLGLAVAFTAALGVGRLAGPQTGQVAHRSGASHTGAAPGPDDGAVAALPGGLQVTDGGYRLVPTTTSLSAGTAAGFRFRILGPDGQPVTRYTPTHDRELHLIVVRRDLSGYQHLHPTLSADGTWAVPLTVTEAGQYRIFADFRPAGRDGALTLGVDAAVAGTYQPRPLPTPARTAEIDGYRVDLVGDLVPGTASRLTLRITRAGAPVTDLQPYLAAYGHLVALRDGDLAYLHVHPDGSPGDGRTSAGPEITFHAEVPSAGAYRLYLDFQHDGAVHTAEFTAVAAGDPPVNQEPARSSPDGHGDQPHGHG